MFAFAIWDSRRQELFVARDRVGIKPLVYYQAPGVFAFASEIRAIRALPGFAASLDLVAIDLYLQFQYIPAPFTIYREVRKLPPAHYLKVGLNGAIEGPTRYWELHFQPDPKPSEGEWLERLDAALADAVRCHLVSDVPFGAFLSGGVDSSTVVAYMQRELRQPVKTFTIGFDETAFNEAPFARAVAQRLGTEHHEEYVRPDALGVLPELVEHYGEPFADSSALPTYYVSKLAGRHVKMVLSGDGGDENFAGYPSYPTVISTVKRLQATGAYRRGRHAVANLGRRLGIWPRLPWSNDRGEIWRRTVAYFVDEERIRMWRPEYRHLVEESRGWFASTWARTRTSELCSRLQKTDIETYLPFDILTKVDIASMCHGLEVRVPLLDHVLMELVASIPARLKLRALRPEGPGSGQAFESKYLLRRIARQHVGDDCLDRPKQGFALPLGEWFQQPLRSVIAERLAHETSPIAEFLELAQVRRLVAENDQAPLQGSRLWALLCLAEWLGSNRLATE
jgi:asparagine synthase (glutamine-hydrolysing)